MTMSNNKQYGIWIAANKWIIVSLILSALLLIGFITIQYLFEHVSGPSSTIFPAGYPILMSIAAIGTILSFTGLFMTKGQKKILLIVAILLDIMFGYGIMLQYALGAGGFTF